MEEKSSTLSSSPTSSNYTTKLSFFISKGPETRFQLGKAFPNFMDIAEMHQWSSGKFPECFQNAETLAPQSFHA